MLCALAVLKTSPNGTFRCSAQLPETMSIDSLAAGHPARPDNWESMYTPEVVAEVRRLVKHGKEKGGRIVICETIGKSFLGAGIAWYDHALPDHVGISAWNRSKFGVMGNDVHAHGDDILDVGFSWLKAADATAFECPPEPWCAEALLAAGIAWYDDALPDHVGISVWNRSKCGVMGADVHAHGDEILDVGFSWLKAADATAFECPPEPWCAEAVTANTDIVEFSAGLIPPLAHLRLLSIGGGHTPTRFSGQCMPGARRRSCGCRTNTGGWTPKRSPPASRPSRRRWPRACNGW